MKLIKLTDLDIGTTYINADRIISVNLILWCDDNDDFCEGSTVEYWDGKGFVELTVTERPEEIQEMVNK